MWYASFPRRSKGGGVFRTADCTACCIRDSAICRRPKSHTPINPSPPHCARHPKSAVGYACEHHHGFNGPLSGGFTRNIHTTQDETRHPPLLSRLYILVNLPISDHLQYWCSWRPRRLTSECSGGPIMLPHTYGALIFKRHLSRASPRYRGDIHSLD